MHRSGTAYREDIARTLYGSSVAWLDQVIRILRVVRTPQIGHRLDLRFLTDAFRVALPPIADDEISQLADGWEQLQRLRDERDTTDQALAAVTEFTRQRWRPWADAVIRAAADPVAAVTSKLTQITREEKSASDAVLKLEADCCIYMPRATGRGQTRAGLTEDELVSDVVALLERGTNIVTTTSDLFAHGVDQREKRIRPERLGARTASALTRTAVAFGSPCLPRHFRR